MISYIRSGNNEIKFLTGTATGNIVEINNKQLCEITTGSLITFSGATADITLQSNKITTNSKFLYSVRLWSSGTGIPVIQSVNISTGQVIITILNVIGQNNSADFNGSLKITVLILN